MMTLISNGDLGQAFVFSAVLTMGNGHAALGGARHARDHHGSSGNDRDAIDSQEQGALSGRWPSFCRYPAISVLGDRRRRFTVAHLQKAYVLLVRPARGFQLMAPFGGLERGERVDDSGESRTVRKGPGDRSIRRYGKRRG